MVDYRSDSDALAHSRCARGRRRVAMPPLLSRLCVEMRSRWSLPGDFFVFHMGFYNLMCLIQSYRAQDTKVVNFSLCSVPHAIANKHCCRLAGCSHLGIFYCDFM